MIRIYSTDQARDGILKRDLLVDPRIPRTLQQGIQRVFGEDLSPAEAVSRIIADVRERGDTALLEWTRQIDGVHLPGLVVDVPALDSALSRISPDLAAALKIAAERIRRFHKQQPIVSWSAEGMGGNIGQRIMPLQRVGVYVPGGTAPLPSSLLMSVIPAQVAGVKEIVVSTPPNRNTGTIHDSILAAASIVGVDGIHPVGGAQAIAAMAFGTETVPRVDKIVGAGNIFVTLAKKQLFGLVGIDGLYGPTETLIIADETADPAWVAADLLAQAEHDLLATAILLTPSLSLAEAVQAQVAGQIESLSRADVIATSLSERGGIVVTKDLYEAVLLADGFAAEHLCLVVREPSRWIDKLEHAGGIFIGEYSFEVLGDYVAGPSHIMPTGGSARYASPLSVTDFLRITSIVELDRETSAGLSPSAARIATAESLTAHASAASMRSDAATRSH